MIPRAILGLLATAALPAAIPGQVPVAAGQEWLPLQAGTRWVWQVTDPERPGEPYRVEARVWGPVPHAFDPGVRQLLVRTGQHLTFEYWSTGARGVVAWSSATMSTMRGFGDPATRLLPVPVGAEARWEWDEGGEGSEAEDALARLRIHHRGELLGVGEEVTVPLGTFRAARVRIRSSCEQWARDRERELWFVRGVGIVREDCPEGDRRIRRELVEFAPGSPAPAADREQILRAQLAAHQDWRGEGDCSVQWVAADDEALYLTGTWAVVKQGGRTAAARVDGDRVILFAVTDKAFWSERWREAAAPNRAAAAAEPVPGFAPADRDDEAWAIHALLQLMARLHGLEQGLRDPSRQSSEASFSVGGGVRSIEAKVECSATDADGKPMRIEAWMKLRGDDLTEAGAKVVAPGGP